VISIQDQCDVTAIGDFVLSAAPLTNFRFRPTENWLPPLYPTSKTANADFRRGNKSRHISSIL
jgi:hypothetical protein